MLYKLAHILRDKYPWIWEMMEWLNAMLFTLRYGKRMKRVGDVLRKYEQDYEIFPISNIDVSELVRFFDAQPQSEFIYFHPHGFDAESLKKLQKNKAFFAYVIKDGTAIVG